MEDLQRPRVDVKRNAVGDARQRQVRVYACMARGKQVIREVKQGCCGAG